MTQTNDTTTPTNNNSERCQRVVGRGHWLCYKPPDHLVHTSPTAVGYHHFELLTEATKKDDIYTTVSQDSQRAKIECHCSREAEVHRRGSTAFDHDFLDLSSIATVATFEDRLREFIREEWCYDAKQTGAVEEAAVNLVLKDLAQAFDIDLEGAING